MKRWKEPPRSVKGLVVAIMAFALTGCPSDSVSIDIRLGTLEVSALTTGARPDPDGYQARVTGGQIDLSRAIGINGTTAFSLAPGDYTVTLEDVAAPCQVADNPRVVGISDGVTSSTIFEVTCG